MVTRQSRLRVVALATCVAASVASCDVAAPIYARTNEPVVNLILWLSDSSSDFQFTEQGHTALFATTGIPTRVEYRDADSFEMFRVRDNARFAWSTVDPAPPPPGVFPFRPTTGNYAMADSNTSAGLGHRTLRAGEDYRLRIALDDRVIEGLTVIPERPRPIVVSNDVVRKIAWQRTRGAALYYVDNILVTVSPGVSVPSFKYTTDTFAVLDGSDPALSAEVTVFALDSNYAKFVLDSMVTRSGITGAYGVFGAVNGTRFTVPPSTSGVGAGARTTRASSARVARNSSNRKTAPHTRLNRVSLR